MARKRQGVTLDNANYVYRYFRQLLEGFEWHDSGSFKTTEYYGDDNQRIKRPFEEMPSYYSCDIESYQRALKRLNNSLDTKCSERTIKSNQSYLDSAQTGFIKYDFEMLDKWVLENVTEKGWSRCLSNIRQQKFASENRFKIKQLKINRGIAGRLETLAGKNDKTIDQLLEILLDGAGANKKLKVKEYDENE